ncbi:MAG: porin family protein [Bacteroidales bacterium]|nr:PorT family protein [Lentimicrobiaceae bacterium]MDD5695950.1 porin family protein [Bacteroidales bacterium]
MKKIILLLILSGSVFMTSTFAQTKPFRFGIKLSPNLGWMKPSTEDYENLGSKVGFGWGFIADITLTDNYFFSTGFDMEWNYGGLKYPDIQADTGMLTRDYKLKYLDIPLSIKMKTNQFDKWAFFGQLGLTPGFRLGATSDDSFQPDDSGVAPTITEKKDINDDISIFRTSILIGGGAEFYFDESTCLVVSLSFKNGITNVLKGTNALDKSLNEKAHYNGLQLNLGVIF